MVVYNVIKCMLPLSVYQTVIAFVLYRTATLLFFNHLHRWHAISIGYSQLIKERKMCVTISKLEFRELDMSPCKTEVEQGNLGNLYPR